MYFEINLLINSFLQFYFQSVLSASHIKQKPKVLRKAIQSGFKKYGQLTDRECCFKFLEILKSVYRFDQERFRCALGVRYKIDLYINIYSTNMIHFCITDITNTILALYMFVLNFKDII